MLRRTTAATAFLLMLNVMAVGDGLFALGASAACDRMVANSAPISGMADMPGMDMAGMDMSGPASPDGEPATPMNDGCNLPWALGCTSVAPCGPTATIAVATHRVTLALRNAEVRTGDVRAPESPALAPELPPPRA